MEDLAREEVPDWPRLLHAGTVSVPTGRASTEDAIEREWQEARRVWTALHDERTPPTDFTAELNAGLGARGNRRQSAAPRRPILDWELWAAFSQRQLMQAVRARHRLLSDLAQPQPEAAFLREIKERYHALALYPVLVRSVAENPDDNALAVSLGRRTAANTPRILTAAAWNLLATKPSFATEAALFPSEERWFGALVPFGTAFDLVNRALRPGRSPSPSMPNVRDWAEAAPYDRWTRWFYEWRLAGGVPPAETVRAAFGPILAYDLSASRQMAVSLRMDRRRSPGSLPSDVRHLGLRMRGSRPLPGARGPGNRSGQGVRAVDGCDARPGGGRQPVGLNGALLLANGAGGAGRIPGARIGGRVLSSRLEGVRPLPRGAPLRSRGRTGL